MLYDIFPGTNLELCKYIYIYNQESCITKINISTFLENRLVIVNQDPYYLTKLLLNKVKLICFLFQDIAIS